MKKVRPLTPDEIMQFVCQIDRSDFRLAAMIILCTGLHIRQVARIRTLDVDFEHRALWVPTRRGIGSVRMPRILESWLKEYVDLENPQRELLDIGEDGQQKFIRNFYEACFTAWKRIEIDHAKIVGALTTVVLGSTCTLASTKGTKHFRWPSQVKPVSK